MKIPLICALLGLGLATPHLQAQSRPTTPSQEARNAAAFNAQMFYQVLLGEMSAANGDVGAAVSLLLDAARKTNDAQLFQRAADLALGARAGETARQVARSWRQAQPRSLDATRYVVQILMALNRVTDTSEPLRALIELTPATERPRLLEQLPSLYSRASDKKLAATQAAQALAPSLADPQTAAPAWVALARVRAMGNDLSGALEAVQRAQAVDPRLPSAALMALALMENRQPAAEVLVRRYLESALPVAAEVRLGYARSLIELQRVRDALTQLDVLTREHPDMPDGWLLLGSLQLDTPRPAQAQASLLRYLALAKPESRHARGLAQAHLMLAQAAEKLGDLAAAERWLSQSDNPELRVQAQSRRASLLARQGRLQEARELIRKLPEREPADARTKLLAETQLLREFKQFQAGFELLAQANAKPPPDMDLLYEQAMMAEKLNRLDDMERLLRQIMAAQPTYHAAYNALGYSLADRGLRLQEAKQLIQKALELAPGDPFIQDSLAWVEFRLGNPAEALRVIELAFRARPDAEIAAHFGEILWSQGQRERAQTIWREGLALNPDNETLRETLKRLQVPL